MLHHADIWRAIDLLAARHNLSPSGLARKAGLSATIFNPSKRTHAGRNRWPSTESIAAILTATGSSLDAFVAMASPEALQHNKLPVLSAHEAGRAGLFDEQGHPTGEAWDELSLPGANDPFAFVLEITGKALEPSYRDGTRVILSPIEKPRRGDRVGLCTKNGEVLFKQLGREGAQKIDLLALNADDPPLTLARKDILWMHRIIWASQ